MDEDLTATIGAKRESDDNKETSKPEEEERVRRRLSTGILHDHNEGQTKIFPKEEKERRHHEHNH